MKINFVRYVAFLGIFSLVLVGCKSKKAKVLESPVVSAPTIKANDSIVINDRLPRPEPVKEKIVVKTPSTVVDNNLKVDLPNVSREFRAAWVATVANINWPSKRTLSTEEQKKEAVALLDLLKDNNFNAVIFQVRPSADALYNSTLEPWSIFLNGETGKAPHPYYDPLEFWVEEAHKRGMELHVWLNPYRAHHSNGGQVSNASMVRKASDYVVRLKNGMYWFDPSDKRTQDHAAAVVNDIVKRYDIDGVHFDDYFYPYASYNGGADFPDDKTWNAYKANGGTLSRADWRRENVNQFIKRVYTEIKAEKNFVKFGLSPFGIWKPGYPAGITGSSQYDELYADAKLWWNEGWVDYFTPQLYWPINPPKQSFTALLKWWQSENKHNRHLWPGLNTVEVKAADRPAEIVKQIEETRNIVPNSPGVVHWSIAGLTKSPAMVDAIKYSVYGEQSLVPKTPWLNANPLLQPSLLLTTEKNDVFAKWQHKQPDEVRNWILYTRYGDEWSVEILPGRITAKELIKQKNGKTLYDVAIRAVDRLGNESPYIAKAVQVK